MHRSLAAFSKSALLILLLTGSAFYAQAEPASMDVPLGTPDPAPVPPTELSTALANKAVLLKWRNVTAPAVSEFHIFRFDNYAPDTTLAPLNTVVRNNPNAPYYSYSDKSVLAGHTYTYFITSKDRFGVHGQNSKMTTVTVPTKF